MIVKPKGYDGTDWQNLGMLFGYSDRLCERVTGICADTTLILRSIVVPANKIWVLQNLVVKNNTASCKCEVGVYDGTNTTYFHFINITTTNLFVTQYAYPMAILKAGDKIEWRFTAVAIGEVVSGHAVGYIMNVA